MTHSCTLKPGWSPLSVGLMVLGFVAFWPLGLAMLAYILWGDRMKTAYASLKTQMRDGGDFGLSRGFGSTAGRSGNVAFDDYRERELNRLEEERRRIDEMKSEFDEFLRNLRRAKDQEEFDRFMASRTSGSTPA